ncbi:hypothetical protein PM082_002325 [Marasmius tenuissimus]|nr:hypothetical protein PM082_002325 [Marasmius tenuissimus]
MTHKSEQVVPSTSTTMHLNSTTEQRAYVHLWCPSSSERLRIAGDISALALVWGLTWNERTPNGGWLSTRARYVHKWTMLYRKARRGDCKTIHIKPISSCLKINLPEYPA